ncbi:MAG: porin [Planctomycetota bacterium]
MAGKSISCSWFSGLVIFGMVVLIGTSAYSAESSGDVEAMRQEIKELRQMVQGLAKEVDDKSPNVDLSDTLGKLKFGGYGEIHSNFTQGSDSDKVDFHRMVLYVGYDFADWIKLHTETELEHAFVKDDDGEISLEQAYVDFLLADNFNIRAGRILTPIGIINQKHEPTLFNGVERPNFSKYIIPTTWSSDGIGLFGALGQSVNYQAYVVAGLDGDSFSSSGIRDGRIKSRQSLNDVAFTSRLDYRPFARKDLRLGISGYYGGLDNTDGGGNGKGGKIAMTSADFEYSISKFDFRGVIAQTDISGARELGGGVAEEMFGWYLEGAYHFLADEWKTGKLEKSDAVVFMRYEEYDTQHKMPSGLTRTAGKDKDELTFGINFYPTSNFVIKVDYQLTNDDGSSDADDRFNIGLGWSF